MPRDIKSIRGFNYGTISNPDISDVPDEAAVASENLDNDTAEGELRSILAANTSAYVVANNAYHGTFVYDDSSDEWTYVYLNKSTGLLRRIADFQGTPSDTTVSGSPSSLQSASFVSKNRATHIGVSSNADGVADSGDTPFWVGWVSNQQWAAVRHRSVGSGQDDLEITDWVGSGSGTSYVKITAGGGATGSGTYSQVDQELTVTAGSAHGLSVGSSILAEIHWEADYQGDTREAWSTETYIVQTVPDSTHFTITVSFTGLGSYNTISWWYAAATATFAYNSGAGYGSNIDIIKGKEYDIGNGLRVKFLSSSGYTTNDVWYFTAVAPGSYSLTSGDAAITNYFADGYFSFSSKELVSSDTNATFTPDNKYLYAYSLIFDGYQETPLAKPGDWAVIPPNGLASVKISITCNGSISSRVTGMNLYRAKTDKDGTAAAELYRLVDSFPMAGSRWLYTSSTNHTLDYNDEGAIGPTYDDQVGISETIDDFSVNYGLNTEVNGYHFVGKAFHGEIPDAAFMIFRSKQGRYDMFNWAEDILHLPNIPTALAAFNGRLYAFDENHVYKINPDGMFIEDILKGVGCLSQRSVLVNNYGMFVADVNGVYWNDGNSFKPLSDPIKYSSLGDIVGGSYATSNPGYYECPKTTYAPILSFHSATNTLMVNVYHATGTYLRTWAYHMTKKRWDYWTYNNIVMSANSGIITAPDGKVYYSNGTATYQLFYSGSYTWIFISKRFDMGALSQKKQLNKITYQGTVTTRTYGMDGANPALTSFTSDTYITLGTSAYFKTIQIYLSDSTNECYGVDIIFRRMIGER